MTNKNPQNSFTIIQALMVICLISAVIIGLFFAKKIIRENNVKSLIMQVKKYDAALNNFTQKYHALPGDAMQTTTYGITEENTDGNGDNVITDRAQQILAADGEISKFWLHLSKSEMLDENYDGKEGGEARIGSSFPLSKIGEKVGIVAFGAEGKTFYQIGFKFADAKRLYTSNQSLKSDEAFLFDKKIDDGNPRRGRVVAVGGNFLNSTKNDADRSAEKTDDCVKFSEYSQEAVSPVCQLRIEVR